MNKKWSKIKLTIISLLIFFSMTSAALSDRWKPGEIITLGGYCVTKDAAVRFSTAIRTSGYPAYDRLMKSSDLKCYHIKRHPGTSVIRSKVISKLWDVIDPNLGTHIEWYHLKSIATGKDLWSWSIVNKPPVLTS